MRRLLALLLVSCGSSEERASFIPPPAAAADAGVEASVTSAPSEDAGSPFKLKIGFTRFYMGDTDRGGTPISYAWEYYGEDLDGLHSSYLLNGECLPPAGQPQYAPIDGINGYDNEWGRRLLPLLQKWDPTPSKASDDALKAGARRPLIMLGQLGGGLTGATLHASFTYSLDGRAEPELASYDAATLANGTFDSGPSKTPVTIELAIGKAPIRVLVQRLRVRFDMTPAGKANGGQLSGAILIADLQAAVAEHVARTDPSQCGGAQIEDLKKSIALAPDVLADGRSDRNARCDAISFGVGFEAEAVTLTGERPYPPAPTPPCP